MADKSIKGSQTEKNLLKAFAGESQARNRYVFFAQAARREGFEQIAKFFEETAHNEEEHGKQFFQHLEGGDLEITAVYPAGIISTTLNNLKHAEVHEKEEWDTLYPSFAATAKEEGFIKVYGLFSMIAEVEKTHKDRFGRLWEEVNNNTIFTKSEKVVWRCEQCGYVHNGTTAPKTCPLCAFPQAYFEIVHDYL